MRTLALLLVLLTTPSVFAAGMPAVGEKAPDFTLTDQNGKPVRLAAFRNKSSVIVAFYPMAFTPG